jgi:hypothetical protein
LQKAASSDALTDIPGIMEQLLGMQYGLPRSA